MNILLLQLFWFSFIPIGISEFGVFARLSRTKKKKFHTFLAQTHSLAALLIAFAAGFSTFIIVVLPGCLLDWPIYYLKIVYFVLLLGSLLFIFLTNIRKALFRRISNFHLTKKNSLIIIVVGGVLALNYFVSLKWGGSPAGDAQFELAQITLFAQKHLTLADPIFGRFGIPPTVYSISIQHGLQALASNLLNMSAVEVWVYSHALFQLVICLSLFAVAWEFIGRKLKAQWSYIVLILIPFLSSTTTLMEYPELHNVIVLAWTALFIIGIKWWLNGGGILLILISSILIASAHPLNSLMAASFLFLLAIVLGIMRLTPIKESVKLLPIIGILLMPFTLFLYFPHGITSAGFNDGSIIGPPLALKSFGFLHIYASGLGFSLMGLLIYAILGIYMIIVSRISNPKIRISILCLLFIYVLLYYNIELISFIGYIYLIITAKNKKVRITIILLTIYLALIIYNPILVALVRGRVPVWSISRFQSLNIFVYLAPVIGILCVLTLPAKAFGYKKLAMLMTAIILILYIFYIPVISLNQTSSGIFVIKKDYTRTTTLNTLTALASFKQQLKGQIVFSDDPTLPALIPAAIATNVFYIQNQANASPDVDIAKRVACAQQLRLTLEPSDLKASGITEIVTSPFSKTQFKNLLVSRPDIQFQEQHDGYSVYSVEENNQVVISPSNICSIKHSYTFNL